MHQGMHASGSMRASPQAFSRRRGHEGSAGADEGKGKLWTLGGSITFAAENGPATPPPLNPPRAAFGGPGRASTPIQGPGAAEGRPRGVQGEAAGGSKPAKKLSVGAADSFLREVRSAPDVFLDSRGPMPRILGNLRRILGPMSNLFPPNLGAGNALRNPNPHAGR